QLSRTEPGDGGGVAGPGGGAERGGGAGRGVEVLRPGAWLLYERVLGAVRAPHGLCPLSVLPAQRFVRRAVGGREGEPGADAGVCPANGRGAGIGGGRDWLAPDADRKVARRTNSGGTN